MASEKKRNDPVGELDLDEDLFGFDELDAGGKRESAENVDLDELFAAIEEPADEELPEIPAAAPRTAPPERPVAPPSPLSAAPEPEPEPRPAAEPVRRGKRDTRARGSGYAKSIVFVLIAVTSLNALVALVSLKAAGDMQTSVWEGARRVAETAAGLRAEERAELAGSHANELAGLAPDPDQHPTFELVRQDVEAGRFADARQRLYALLAIVDRLEPEVQDELEARACYLIAEASHLEAVGTTERGVRE